MGYKNMNVIKFYWHNRKVIHDEMLPDEAKMTIELKRVRAREKKRRKRGREIVGLIELLAGIMSASERAFSYFLCHFLPHFDILSLLLAFKPFKMQ